MLPILKLIIFCLITLFFGYLFGVGAHLAMMGG